jgi:ferric-dicitrate binding protein FerR (iron transport regulator)
LDPGVDARELDSEAINWLVRTEAANCTCEEQAQLEAWLAAPRHRAAYLRMRAAWSQADQLRRLQPLDGRVDPDLLRAGSMPVPRAMRESGGRLSRAPPLGYILAAIALIAFVSAVTAWLVSTRLL